MSAVFASLVPVFLVIAMGWLARTTRLVEDRQWQGLERITYVVFFPTLIIDTLARADLASVPVVGVGGALMGAVLLVSGLVLALRPVLEGSLAIDGPSFTSVFQGATRWNTFVAIAVAGGLHGPRGVALMAVAIAAMVPLLNVLAIYVFVRYAGGPSQTAGRILRTVAANPFIWSCAVGLALNPVSSFVPAPVLSFAEIVGRAALPAGLLVVGAGLDARSLARPRSAHLVTMALKLVAMPVLAVLLARAFGVRGDDIAIAVIAASVPTASAAYVLSRQLGGNAPLMAEILTLQTLVAMASMPLMITLLTG
ncbi:MAG TPA: AEC family transporter [Microvirga sp.]|jgi:malonate transporter|nr:AEC family transporter [Microvirga sp.]